MTRTFLESRVGTGARVTDVNALVEPPVLEQALGAPK